MPSQDPASASQIILAEAKSEHRIAAEWRLILMLPITTIVAWNHFIGLLVGVGGYTVGRSAEKVAKRMKN